MSGPTLLVTPTEIDDAYKARQDALRLYLDVDAERIEQDAYLKTMEAKALLDGTIEGKNVQAREAAAREYFAAEYEKLEKLEAESRKYRAELDVIEIECKRLHALMRLMEIENSVAALK